MVIFKKKNPLLAFLLLGDELIKFELIRLNKTPVISKGVRTWDVSVRKITGCG